MIWLYRYCFTLLLLRNIIGNPQLDAETVNKFKSEYRQHVLTYHDISEDLNVPFSYNDISIIDRIASINLGSSIESNNRRIISVLTVQEGMEDFELFSNFVLSVLSNAHEFAHKKLLIIAFDDKISTFCRYHGIQNIIRIDGADNKNFVFKKFSVIHTLLMLNISVLSLSINQVILKNPLEYLVGDSDLEISTNYPKPSLILNQEITENPISSGMNDLADSLNPELMFISTSLNSIELLQSFLLTEGSLASSTAFYRNHHRRFNLMVLIAMKAPVQFCYGNNIYKDGFMESGKQCQRSGTQIALRILRMEQFTNGPGFLWAKLYCHIDNRNENFLEIGMDKSLHSLPKCDSESETSGISIIHFSGVEKLSKAYFMRERLVWYAGDDALRFQKRRLISSDHEDYENAFVSRDNSTNNSNNNATALPETLSDHLKVFILSIAWTIATKSELILPKFPCKYLPEPNNLYRLSDIHHRGLCPLDYFLEISYLNDLLVKAELKQTDKPWNKVQVMNRNLQLSFVEHSFLFLAKEYSKGYSITTDSRVKINAKRLGWASELWGKRLIKIQFTYIHQNSFIMEAVWPNNIRKSADSSSEAQVKSLMEYLLENSMEYHIRLYNLRSEMTVSLIQVLFPYMAYLFDSPSQAYSRIITSLVCDPQQLFMQKFSSFYTGYKWDMKLSSYGCGLPIKRDDFN